MEFDIVEYRFSLKIGKILIKIKNQIKRKFLVLEKYDKEKLIRVKAIYKGMLNYCIAKSIYNKKYKNEE